jgi:hypothetical protein
LGKKKEKKKKKRLGFESGKERPGLREDRRRKKGEEEH